MVTIVSNSANSQNEMLDQKIAKTKQLFHQELMRKKRNIKRKWLDINAITYEHCLQLLPYRSMLQHVHQLTEERREQILQSASSAEARKTQQQGENVEDDDIRSRITSISIDRESTAISIGSDEKSCDSDNDTQSEDEDEYICLPMTRPKSKGASDFYEPEPEPSLQRVKKDSLGLQIP